MARIIISDDDRVSLLVLKNIVDFLGHEPITSSNGEEAVQEFKKSPSELVILDVNMPVMNGIEACKKIRQLPGGGTVPIIIVSGLDDEKDVIEGLNAGANDYLLKPVKDSHLLAKLKIFLRMSSLHNSDFELTKQHAVFAGKYKIRKILGYGSHSVVFLTEDISSENRKTALKLFKENANISTIYDSFAETAQKLKETDCKYLLKTYDYGQCDGRLFVAMQFAERGDLSKILKSKTFSQLEGLTLGLQISEAIQKIAEKNIVHFDIKPQNIMIAENKQFLLADFGVASPKSSMTISIKNEIWASPAYMPPEYLSGDEIFPGLSDIYSLGVTLYEVLSGSNPFYSERAVNSMISQINLVPPPLTEIDERFNPQLSKIIELMMNKNPNERPSPEETIKSFSDILTEISNKLEKDFRLFIHREFFSKEEEKIEEPVEQISPNSPNEPIKFKIPKNKKSIKDATEQVFTTEKVKKEKVKSLNSFDIMSFIPYFELPSVKIPDLSKIIKVFLLIFGLAAAIFAGKKIYSQIFSESEEEVQYLPLTVLKCEKCGYMLEKRTNQIPEICTKCSGTMWTAYECEDCKNIFPLIETESVKINHDGSSPYTCPNCKSENTSPILTSEEYRESKGIK